MCNKNHQDVESNHQEKKKNAKMHRKTTLKFLVNRRATLGFFFQKKKLFLCFTHRKMNERSKVVPPLSPRDRVTCNVIGRFVSPLPAATILSTPSSLRGTTSSSSSNTARPSSSSGAPNHRNPFSRDGKEKPLMMLL